jgi:hypothetical protein
MCRLKTFFCNFDLVVKLAPLAGKSMFACYYDAEFVNSEAKSTYSPFLIFCFILEYGPIRGITMRKSRLENVRWTVPAAQSAGFCKLMVFGRLWIVVDIYEQ